MLFYWNLSHGKYLQVSRILLRILVHLNNAVIWMVSACLLISKSSNLFTKLLCIVPSVPITIGITVNFMFYIFFRSLARSKYLSLFSLSFIFPLWSAGTAKSTIQLVHFFLLSLRLVVWFYIIIILLFWDFFFPPALADCFSPDFEGKQVSSSYQDSSQYSGRSQQCCS